eukprot:gene3428-25565_t
MSKVVLYTQPGVPNGDLVTMYLAETGLGKYVDVKIAAIGRDGDMRSPAGLKMNPLGEVPVLQKLDGKFLSESISICEYIDAEFGPTTVVGLNASDRADTSMWVRRVEQKVVDHMGNAFRYGPMAAFFTKRRGAASIIPEAAAGSIKAARSGLEFMETQFAADGRKYLGGDTFTLADLAFYCRFAFFLRKDKSQSDIIAGLPHVAAYVARVQALPSAAATQKKKKPAAAKARL